jgi:hypothetical protein
MKTQCGVQESLRLFNRTVDCDLIWLRRIAKVLPTAVLPNDKKKGNFSLKNNTKIGNADLEYTLGSLMKVLMSEFD